ncbi:MAG: ATP-binding cassette domain-containing protein [Clostridia bacterium]
MEIIKFNSVSYDYPDGTNALDNIDISIEEGSSIAILGGNGSGKSTLFLHCNGIYKPSKGEVYFKGEKIEYNKKSLFDLRKNIGIVFQNSDEQLFSSNVRNDILFGMKNLKLGEEEINKRFDIVVERTGVKDLLNKPTHALSFGQKKRVAIAGVLAMQPSVIILDEPTAGLDPQGTSEILQLITEIKKDLGITIIFSTHEIDLVPLYCDKAIILNNGKIAYNGDLDYLWNNPKILRENNLRLPRIAHLMEILSNKDGWDLKDNCPSISGARVSLKSYMADITLEQNEDFKLRK